MSGGTEPYQPMAHCLDKIIEGDKNADIVITSDGYFDQPPQEFLDKLEIARSKTDVKIFAITSLGGSDHEASKFADYVIDVKSFYDDRAKLIELFREIV